ncbi:hypothetical protein WOB78_13430 [Vibrio parahaemolyticus]
MHPLQNGSQVTERPADKPVSGQPGYFTESGENNVPSYPGADWFNNVIDEFLNFLSSQGVPFDPSEKNNMANALKAFPISQKYALTGLAVERSIVERNQDFLNILDVGNPSSSDWTSVIQQADSLANTLGKVLHFVDGIEYEVSSTLHVTAPWILPNKSTLKITNDVDVFLIHSTGSVSGGGKIDLSSISFTSSVVKYDTLVNGGSYDLIYDSSKPLNGLCGLQNLTVITNDTSKTGTAIHLRCYNELPGNQYISWLFHNNLRLVGRFENGILIDREEVSQTWINGNIFDTIIIDKSVNKISGETQNTYNTYNNIITQPNSEDVIGNDSTVDLTGGYSQGMYWDGDAALLNGGHDDIQRIVPNRLFYGSNSSFRLANLGRGITNSPWFSRKGISENILGLKSLVPSISGGASAQVARGNSYNCVDYTFSWKVLSNTHDIDNESNFITSLPTETLIFGDGAYKTRAQKIGLASGQGNWGRVWGGGSINPSSMSQTHILVSTGANDGVYRIGIGDQSDSSLEGLNDGAFVEIDPSLDTYDVVLVSGGLERQRVSVPIRNLVAGHLLSIYIVGIGSEIKIAVQWVVGGFSAQDHTKNYTEMVLSPNKVEGSYSQTALTATQPSSILRPFVQLKNSLSGSSSIYLHTVESLSFRTRIAI